MTKINLNKGHIDWTKEDTVMISRSDVRHSCLGDDNDAKLSKNYVTFDQDWSTTGYDIVDNGEYLSLKQYSIDGPTNSVHDFVNTVRSGNNDNLYLSIKGTYSYRYEKEDNNEFRIYKDRNCILLGEKTYGNKTLNYTINKDGLKLSFYSVVTWLNNFDSDESKETLRNIQIINNEEDAKRYSRPLTENMKKYLNSYFDISSSDLRNRHIKRISGYCYPFEFNKETQEIVEDFLEINSPKNKILRHNFQKKYKYDNIISINSLTKLFDWLACKNKLSEQSKSKQETANELIKEIPEWNYPEDHINEAIWFRTEDYVAVAKLKEGQNSSYISRNCGRRLFGFNLNTKKRFYGECDESGIWTFPVPSMKYIIDHMWLGEKSSYNQDKSEYEYYFDLKTSIKNDLSINELFKDTNIEWILNNMPKDTLVMDNEKSCYYGSDIHPIKISDVINKERIGNIAIAILITTGDKMMEQLLKSKLFNLYFGQLNDMILGYNDDKPLIEKSKTDNYNYRDYSTILVYDQKQKNLKKMFGYNLTMLHQIDEAYKLKYGVPEGRYYYTPRPSYYRDEFSLVGLKEIFGDSLNRLDQETFKDCLRISSRRGSYSESVWRALQQPIIDNCKNMKPKDIVKYIDEFTKDKENIDILKDYLNMRTQLKALQENHPDTKIFTNESYPLRPLKAERYIHYISGTTYQENNWSPRREMTREAFIQYYSRQYAEAIERKDAIFNFKDGDVDGLIIKMTPSENLLYLHDQASYWINCYQDEAKNVGFKKAVERVKNLEWKDPKLGLEIIAPERVQDVQNEGSVLHHCVSSYVDPIINGTENILFLRRMDMPEHPFYTVEVVGDGEIRQVHCFCNGNPTKEDQARVYKSSGYEVYNKVFDIQAFLKKWAKEKGLKNVKESYGALCARR